MPAHAPMTLLTVLSHAPPFVTVVMLLLLGLSITAFVVGAAKLRPGAPLAGGSAFVAERFHADSFWTTVEKVGPSFFSAVPTIYAMLTSRPGPPPGTRRPRRVAGQPGRRSARRH